MFKDGVVDFQVLSVKILNTQEINIRPQSQGECLKSYTYKKTLALPQYPAQVPVVCNTELMESDGWGINTNTHS